MKKRVVSLLTGKWCQESVGAGYSYETLCKVPLVIAVACGVAKAEAILGALCSGVVNVLVTDELSVRAVLNCAAHRKFAELSST